MTNNSIGFKAGKENTTGNGSLPFGLNASKNIVIGLNAGITITTGSNNILIGDNVDLDFPEQCYFFNSIAASFEMTPDLHDGLYRTFMEKGLAEMLKLVDLHIKEGYPNVLINK